MDSSGIGAPRTAVWLLAALVAVGALVGCRGGIPIGGRPDANPRGPYRILVAEGGGPYEEVVIGQEGAGCERLAAEPALSDTCHVAIELIPTVIGGSAQGKLNTEHTPALDALIWRARASDDIGVCAAGGLLNAFLNQCRAAATSADYVDRAGEISVQVPIGGALPPDPSPTKQAWDSFARGS